MTNGIIPENSQTKKVAQLHELGLAVSEIAVRLNIGENAVSAHLPYTRGAYKKENPSANALKIREHRLKKT